jgi:hypothetical protein
VNATAARSPSRLPEPTIDAGMDALAAWEAWSGALRGEVEPETWRQYTAAALRFLALAGSPRQLRLSPELADPAVSDSVCHAANIASSGVEMSSPFGKNLDRSAVF